MIKVQFGPQRVHLRIQNVGREHTRVVLQTPRPPWHREPAEHWPAIATKVWNMNLAKGGSYH